MCNCDVPRNAMGWPTVGPEFFNETQLRKEAEKWRGGGKIMPSITAYQEWERYATELHRRGFVEIVDPRVPLLASDETYARNEEERKANPRRPSVWAVFSRKAA
ncbi:hypothetical protein [Rhizobium sp. BK176]|uniref:hypothetical protein n=1 Tax=Rhizobium sp. BK176 TaxID=2587071 RepID=UPI0021698995|nr:hypothetical protein [Rhizobium sp. BK176]MCS4090242.1 hypothetical protein [Rhizobium sp. BK176]